MHLDEIQEQQLQELKRQVTLQVMLRCPRTRHTHTLHLASPCSITAVGRRRRGRWCTLTLPKRRPPTPNDPVSACIAVPMSSSHTLAPLRR